MKDQPRLVLSRPVSPPRAIAVPQVKPAPRPGSWGAATVGVACLALVGAWAWPSAMPQAEEKKAETKVDLSPAMEAKPVDVEILPQRVQEALAQPEAEAPPLALDPPAIKVEPAPYEEAVPPLPPAPPLPASLAEAPIVAPAEGLAMRPKPKPPELRPAASPENPGAEAAKPGTPGPEEALSAHGGDKQEGEELAAVSLMGADDADQVQAWLAAGLAEIRVSSGEKLFRLHFGARGFLGPIDAEALSAARQGSITTVHFGAGAPPGLPLETLQLRLGEAGLPIRIDSVVLVLTGTATRQILAAQDRLVADLKSRNLLPEKGIRDLKLTICLPQGGIAVAERRSTRETLPLASTCKT